MHRARTTRHQQFEHLAASEHLGAYTQAPQGPVTIEHAKALGNVSWRAFYLHRLFVIPPDPNGVHDGAWSRAWTHLARHGS